MNTLVIEGGARLKGKVKVSGAKNSALPILAATILVEGQVCIENVPSLLDTETMCAVLSCLGAKVSREGERVMVQTSSIGFEAPYELVGKMRASFLVLGPLLSRRKRAKVSLPGGCAIGTRPVNMHIDALSRLGAKIRLKGGYIEAEAKKLSGTRIVLDFPSVGATENTMMAATLAEGVTVIEGAAKEPEVVDLANFLCSCGASIKGAGTDVIVVEGKKELLAKNAYRIISDRIEAATFMIAAAMTGGSVKVEGANPSHLSSVLEKLTECGARVKSEEGSILVQADKLLPLHCKTMPYPGFPTDLQAQMMALCCIAKGTSTITETIFENRFLHVDELRRMGACIRVDGATAVVDGAPKLSGAPVRATDLRASAALVLAGLVAEGKTIVHDIHHLDRGYERIEQKLASLGAKIRRECA
jgi:UDP-N-acetylglucosamine 1-carboxyvinyltransferase